MKTYEECLPCFFHQAERLLKMAKATKAVKAKILSELNEEIKKFPRTSCPPEMARIIFSILRRHTGLKDPYAKEKKKSNELCLKIYPKLKEMVENSKKPLMKAVELSIAGNILDFGTKKNLRVEEELKKILNNIRRKERPGVFNFEIFKKTLEKSEDILYLGDNAGETVFDRVLIEEILAIYKNKKITYAVKEKPILNDALREDAVFCGLDKHCKIISSGSTAPGTVLKICSKSFLKHFEKTSMIISKGQGNFEALYGNAKREIFFLFLAKCPVVCRERQFSVGDIVLLLQKN